MLSVLTTYTYTHTYKSTRKHLEVIDIFMNLIVVMIS